MSNPLWFATLGVLQPVLFAQLSSHGTAIAFVRTREEIVVATDSRSITSKNEILPNACKIRNAGRLYFSVVGQTKLEGIDLEAIVERNIRASGTLGARLESLEKELKPILEHGLETNPAARERADRQGSIMSTLVYGHDGKRLVVRLLKFNVADGRLTRPEKHRCPGDCPGGRIPLVYPEGVFDLSIPTTTAAQKLVQGAIDTKRIEFGPPLQLMRIDSTGKHEWIPKKPDVCKDQP